MSLWPRLRRDLDRRREFEGWSTLRALYEVLVIDSGFQALMLHRIAHTLRRWRIPILPGLLRRLGVALCGVDILPQARIGAGCVLSHGLGTVIGGTSVIGEDCTILQGVTLGEARFEETANPRVGDRVILGAGATLLGDITIGDDVMVAAGAVVLEDVPAGTVVGGIPARVISGPGTDSQRGG